MTNEEEWAERERIFRPMNIEKGISYKEFEGPIRQVMNYYAGYRRNEKGMETALEKLDLIESYQDKIKAPNYHELMKANETAELIKIARLTIRACMERKESGRAYFRRTDFPEMDPSMGKPLVLWKEGDETKILTNGLCYTISIASCEDIMPAVEKFELQAIVDARGDSEFLI